MTASTSGGAPRANLSGGFDPMFLTGTNWIATPAAIPARTAIMASFLRRGGNGMARESNAFRPRCEWASRLLEQAGLAAVLGLLATPFVLGRALVLGRAGRPGRADQRAQPF